jgi:hypothetical protein
MNNKSASFAHKQQGRTLGHMNNKGRILGHMNNKSVSLAT